LANGLKTEPKDWTNEAHSVRRLKIYNWIILILLTAATGVFLGARFSLSVLCGGLVVIANFHILYRALRRAFSSTSVPGSAGLVFKYYLRLIATGVALLLLIKVAGMNPVGLIVGLSTVALNLMLCAVIEIVKLFR